MTPAEHLAEAERLLAIGEGQMAEWGTSNAPWTTQAALVHAVIAAAAELGVPHAPEATGGASVPAG